jgi:hypothetical protein
VALFSIHLLDRDGRVMEIRNVRAIRNYEAVDLAAQLCRAAAKDCAAYEVWRDGRRIRRALVAS